MRTVSWLGPSAIVFYDCIVKFKLYELSYIVIVLFNRDRPYFGNSILHSSPTKCISPVVGCLVYNHSVCQKSFVW